MELAQQIIFSLPLLSRMLCHHIYAEANIFFCISVFPRSLCVDALIELSDENADWKLSFDEFLNCLKPGFNPPEKSELNEIL